MTSATKCIFHSKYSHSLFCAEERGSSTFSQMSGYPHSFHTLHLDIRKVWHSHASVPAPGHHQILQSTPYPPWHEEAWNDEKAGQLASFSVSLPPGAISTMLCLLRGLTCACSKVDWELPQSLQFLGVAPEMAEFLPWGFPTL